MNLPKSWTQCTLGEIIKLEYGKALPEKLRFTGDAPVYGSNGVVGSHSKCLIDQECLIVGRKGAAGEVHIALNGCWPIDTTYFVLPPSGIPLKFLYYLIKNLNLTKLDRSTAIPGLNRDDAYSQNIPLPPLPEQHRIVAKIEELFSDLDAGIASLRKAKKQLKIYRQSVLKWAFEGKLTAEWRKTSEPQIDADYSDDADKTKKNPKHSSAQSATSARISGSDNLPAGWKWERLGNLPIKIFDGPFGSHLKSSDYIENPGVRVIRLENIGFLEFREDKYSYITNDKYLSLSNHTVFSGDIIFSSFIAEGTRVAIIPPSIKKAVNKADCFCIRLLSDRINTKYIHFFLSTKTTYNQLVPLIHGATRPRINTTQLKNCYIPICSTSEQSLIVSEIESRLSVADNLEKTIDASLTQADALRQSILKRAFEGKLVPQDPKDLPAAELLKQIRAERTSALKARPEAKKRKGAFNEG
jgi:type I restriction enzyme S subunit